MRYEVIGSQELQAVKIKSDLYRIIFFVNSEGLDLSDDEFQRRYGAVYSAIRPKLPELGYTCSYKNQIEVYGLLDIDNMAKLNREHVDREVGIDEEIHSLEFVLTKAKNSNILPYALYQQIRIDVRNRVMQLRSVEDNKKQVYQDFCDELSVIQPTIDFKPIKKASDTIEFAGKIIAYMSDLYYFSGGKKAVVHPADDRIRFAKVSSNLTSWSGGGKGYDMDTVLNGQSGGGSKALIDQEISRDSGLAMRLATVDELAFLKKTLELDQGRFEFDYRDNTHGIEVVDRALEILGHHEDKIQPSWILPKFTAATNRQVDWHKERECKERAEFIYPSSIYIIIGGTKEERKDKATALRKADIMSMFGIYHSADKKQLAIVFSCKHGAFDSMTFNKAQEIVEEIIEDNVTLPKTFMRRFIEIKHPYGIIDLEKSELTTDAIVENSFSLVV